MTFAPKGHEPTVVPGAVIADVGAQHGFRVGELAVPEGEVPYEPLSVGPDVVVLGVFGEHAGEEGEFAGGKSGDRGHDYLAVVPMGVIRMMRRCEEGKGLRITRFGSSLGV